MGKPRESMGNYGKIGFKWRFDWENPSTNGSSTGQNSLQLEILTAKVPIKQWMFSTLWTSLVIYEFAIENHDKWQLAMFNSYFKLPAGSGGYIVTSTKTPNC